MRQGGVLMGYVEKHLRSGEHIVARAKVSKAVFLVYLLKAGIFVAVVYKLLALISGIELEFLQNFLKAHEELLSVCFTGAVFLAVIYVLLQILQVACVELAVTEKKITGKTGVIYAKALDVSLDKIESYQLRESLPGRIFGYSSLIIGTASSEVTFPYIVKAKQFRNMVMDCVDARERERASVISRFSRQPGTASRTGDGTGTETEALPGRQTPSAGEQPEVIRAAARAARTAAAAPQHPEQPGSGN